MSAQTPTGEIRGTITDGANAEPVVHATVILVGTKLGAVTDMHGVFTVRRVPAGTYTVRVSSVGYAAREFSDVKVSDHVAALDAVLQPAAVKTKGVEVTAKASLGTEAALLNERRKSANVSDGISASQIKRLPDATGADALARVTGMSIVGGRYANVRGSNERYNNTQLNGVTMVSTEPGRRAFSFDLFPASLLENTVVAKTFTPNLPGDFSGGLVQLNTIDFPTERTVRIALSTSYESGTTFHQLDMGPRSSTDYLGFDNGMRGLPTSFPDTGKITRNSGEYTPEQIAALARSMPNNYKITPRTATPTVSLSAAYGDRLNLFDNDFGLVAAVSYRSGYEHADIKRYDTTLGSIPKYDYAGTRNEYSVLWGGIANLSYKLGDLHTISVKNTYSHALEDQLTMAQGSLNAEFENHPYVFQYLERSFYSGQVAGSHLFPDLDNARLEWRAFGTLGSRSEPDLRRVTYTRQLGDTSIPLQTPLSPTLVNAYGVGRVYTDLDEDVAGFSGDATLPVGPARIKFGGLTENRSRRVATRSFSYVIDVHAIMLSQSALDTLFQEDHLASNKITIEESTSPSDRYSAHSHLRAAYLMTDIPFEIGEQQFRTILGTRVEDQLVVVHTVDANAKPLTVEYPTTDWLPSASLIYEITPAINLRLAFSKTLSRPDFREFARTVYYDFIADALTYGNAGLRRSVITNYDFRFEVFPNPGELLALSVFHKTFVDAIEEVALLTGSTQLERTWMNTNGTNTGVEVEARASLGFIASDLDLFSFGANYTWLDSRLDLTDKTGERQRRLQGQSPYLINAGLYYDNPTLGMSASLAYNRIGERINTVSATTIPDLIEQPRDRVDFSFMQTILANYELKLTVKDLLAQDILFTQLDRDSRVDKVSPTISLGITLKL